ncbi:MAG: A24 family peptidase [Candidatus Acidiferrales bacterium]
MAHFNAGQTVWLFTLAFACTAGWVDSRTQRIPNWLTVPGLLLGIALHSALSGWTGTEMALEGAGLGLLVLLPLVLLRALGAGDWKLMGAIGALLGPAMLWFVLLASIFAAGLMAAVLVIRARRVRETLRNMGMLITGFLTFGLRAPSDVSLDNPRLLKLPFGVAVAIGTLVCFVAAGRGL